MPETMRDIVLFKILNTKYQIQNLKS